MISLSLLPAWLSFSSLALVWFLGYTILCLSLIFLIFRPIRGRPSYIPFCKMCISPGKFGCHGISYSGSTPWSRSSCLNFSSHTETVVPHVRKVYISCRSPGSAVPLRSSNSFLLLLPAHQLSQQSCGVCLPLCRCILSRTT